MIFSQFGKLALFLLCFGLSGLQAQVIFSENFDDAGAAGRWRLEDTPGSLTNPTPTGIQHLHYNGSDAQTNSGCNNYWIINNRHVSSGGTSAGARCGGGGANQSMHITWPEFCPDGADVLQRQAPSQITEPADGGDTYFPFYVNPLNPAVNPSSDQMAVLINGFSTVGRCNIVLSFDAYLGGELSYENQEFFDSHSILASTDGGATWIVAAKDLQVAYSRDPQCGPWVRYNVGLNRELYNQPNVILAFRFRNLGMRTGQAGTNLMFNAAYNVDNIEVTASATNPTITADRDITSPCKNQTVTFRNTTSTFVKGINYEWRITPSTGFTVVSGQANTVVADSLGNLAVRFTSNGAYTVSLRANTACNVDLTPVTFNVNVANCPPQADFVAYQSTACSTVPSPTTGSVTVLQLTDLSTSFPPITSWSWNIPGAEYVNGTSATSQHPEVRFNTAGAKNVTLTVTNAEGNNVVTKNGHLTIADCQCQLITGGGGTPTVAFYENFETHSSISSLTADSWTIGPPVPWSASGLGGNNKWIVNNDYSSMSLDVFGTPIQTLNPTPAQTGVGTVTNGPNSNYFHVTVDASGLATFSGASAQWFTNATSSTLVATTKTIDCSNLQNVNLSMIWGSTAITGSFMRIIDASNSSVLHTQNLMDNQVSPLRWNSLNLTAAGLSNVLDGKQIRLEFNFNPASNGVNEPNGPYMSLSVDEIRVEGVTTGGASSPTTFVCPLPSPLCAGQTLAIPFNAAGTWNAGNVFTAQLSNASGGFGSPTAVGTLSLSGNNLTGNTINITIPGGTASGTGYRIRVVGSAPSGGSQTNNDNGENIEIQALPALNNITGANSVCTGGLANSYTVASRSGVSYNWTITPGAQGANWDIVGGQGTTNLQVRWLQVGTYTLRMTETNGCGNRQNNLTVNVTGAPRISDITGPLAVCQSATPVNYSVQNNPGTTTWAWTITNGTISSGANTATPTVVWNTATGPGSLTLTETNNCGTANRTFTIYVNNGAPATPTISGSLSACANSTEAYQATPPTGLNYTWNITGGTIVETVTPSFVIVQWGAAGAGTVGLSVSNGCGNANATPLNVTIAPSPSVTSFNITPTATVCSDAVVVQIAPVFSNGGTGVTIDRWEVDMGSGFTTVPSSAGVNPLSVTNIQENRTYRIVYSSGGCVDLLSATTANITFGSLGSMTCNLPANVGTGQAVTNATITMPGNATPPFTVTFEPIEGNPEPAFTSSNTTITLPSFTYAADGTYNYRVTVEDANGCLVDCSGSIEALNTGITNLQTDNTNYCSTETVNVTFGTVGVFGPSNQFNLELRDQFDQVVFTRNNVQSPVALSIPQLTGVTPGDYRVRVSSTDPAGIEAFSSFFMVSPTPDARFSMFSADNPTVPTTVFVRDANNIATVSSITNTSTHQGTCSWVIQTDAGGVINCNDCDPANCGIFPINYSDPAKQVFFTATLTVTDPSGNCSDVEVVTFRINSQVVQLPNVFTPNNDGINDYFGVDPNMFRSFELHIFNRWGALVFNTSTGSNKMWDGKDNNGKDVPEGTYVYKLIGKDLIGRDYEKVGNVTVIR
ncbi:MAG: gliding motility-associated C-terminal domain-containing protein [Bacteroidetes bacterium]|nr:gliding motility-associated C-terminal domain-containing protein [Bacteroidota bacterium]